MVKREGKGSAGSLSRGAELWIHQARLFVVAIWTVVLISISAGLATTAAYFRNTAATDRRYALERNVLAHTRGALYTTAEEMELNVNGELHRVEVFEIALLADNMVEDAWRELHNGGMFDLLTSTDVASLISLYWWGYNRERVQDNQLRGAKLVEGKELTRLTRHRDEAGPYEIVDVPMCVKPEMLHTLFTSAQGTGKSQQPFVLMKQVRARDKRVIVHDPTNELVQVFCREGRDVLMSPLDPRSPGWNIWNKITKDCHFDNMANDLIPDPAESDPFRTLAGRTVLKGVIAILGRGGRRMNRDLYNVIAKSNLDAMRALLQGAVSAIYADPMTKRTGVSFKMAVQSQPEAFRFLSDEDELFSIRKWVHEEGDSWMLITAQEVMHEAPRSVLSLQVDMAVKAILDLEPIHRERFWSCIDKLSTLQKLDILRLILTNTRKYGLCMVLGMQDFSQLYEVYGHGLVKTIISGCQTKLLLRVTDGAVVKLLAELMGQTEVDEKDETLSYGLSSQRGGVNVMAYRQMRNLVLTSEILTLPDMAGYLLAPGGYPIARAKCGYVPTEKQANGFVERDGSAISFKPATVTAAPASIPSATEVRQPAAPGQGDMLDDDNMGVPTTVGVMRNENGDMIDGITDEVIKPAEKVSCTKDDVDAKSAGQGEKSSPLADALQEDTK